MSAKTPKQFFCAPKCLRNFHRALMDITRSMVVTLQLMCKVVHICFCINAKLCNEFLCQYLAVQVRKCIRLDAAWGQGQRNGVKLRYDWNKYSNKNKYIKVIDILTIFFTILTCQPIENVYVHLNILLYTIKNSLKYFNISNWSQLLSITKKCDTLFRNV